VPGPARQNELCKRGAKGQFFTALFDGKVKSRTDQEPFARREVARAFYGARASRPPQGPFTSPAPGADKVSARSSIMAEGHDR